MNSKPPHNLEDMFSRDFSQQCYRAWQLILWSVFLIFCVRFQISAILENLNNTMPTVVLSAVCFITSLWHTEATFVALLSFLPIVAGLSQMGIYLHGDPLSLAFSAAFLGFALRRALWFSPNELTSDNSVGRWDARLLVHFFVSFIIISVAAEIYDKHAPYPDIILHSTYGFGDTSYFLTSSFIWLEGCFLFLAFSSCRLTQGHSRGATEQIFTITTLSFVPFTILQVFAKVPEQSASLSAFSANFEDINSCGAFGVACFAYWLYQIQPPFSDVSRRVVLLAATASATVILSWSRAAWASGLIMLYLAALISWSRKLFTIGVIALIALVAVVNTAGNNDSWRHSAYLGRLSSLLRIERVENKSKDRFFLYEKAGRMIKEKPVAGYGIGSFYHKSVYYSSPGDPLANEPDFAHNMFLQVAVELGVPAAGILLYLVGHSVYRAKQLLHDRFTRRLDGGLASALAAFTGYLLTQLTANSLNVYITNQLLFWFLLFVVVSSSVHSSRGLTIKPSGNI